MENPHIFEASSDVAYADNRIDHKSSQGYIVCLYQGPIDRKASKQNTVSASSTEAELLSLSKTTREVFWWTRLFKDIRLDIGHQPSAQCDNRLTIRLLTAETAKLNTRLRHVDVYHHWLHQSVQTGGTGSTWVSTVEMPAGGLTKALPRQKHQDFVKQTGLIDIAKQLVSAN